MNCFYTSKDTNECRLLQATRMFPRFLAPLRESYPALDLQAARRLESGRHRGLLPEHRSSPSSHARLPPIILLPAPVRVLKPHGALAP